MNSEKNKFWAVPGYIEIKKPWAQDKMKIIDGQTGEVIYDAEKELAKGCGKMISRRMVDSENLENSKKLRKELKEQYESSQETTRFQEWLRDQTDKDHFYDGMRSLGYEVLSFQE